jgi:hypothetical protein
VGEVDQFSGNQLVPLPSEWRRRRLSLDDWRENELTDNGGPACATPPPPRDFRAAVGEALGVAFGVASGDGVSSRIWPGGRTVMRKRAGLHEWPSFVVVKK